MQFRMQYSISGTQVRNGTSLRVEIRDIQITISLTTYEHDSTKPLLLVEALCDRTPPSEAAPWITDLAEGRCSSAPPDEIDRLLSPLFAELSTAGRHAFESLRWLTASDTPHTPYGHLGQFVSVDGGRNWHRIHPRGTVVAWQVTGLPLDTRSEQVLQQLVRKEDSREPIGHVLYREASDSRLRNPRSAVVVGVAALETATKSTIADLVPGTQWLVENLTSPPVTRLLKDYLPTLPARLTVSGTVYAPPQSARRLIHAAVEQRNRVAHRGRMSMSSEEVLDFLDAVRNTLYLLDYYRGHEWAMNLIDPAYRDGLGS